MLAAPASAPETDDIDPIDIAEALAEYYEWGFDRLDDRQIAVEIVGKWSTYSITLANSQVDGSLRLVAAFELKSPGRKRIPLLYELLNQVNEGSWFGALTWWEQSQRIVWRSACLPTSEPATSQQVATMITNAVTTLERIYPVVYGVCWAEQSVETAMKSAFSEAYGRA